MKTPFPTFLLLVLLPAPVARAGEAPPTRHSSSSRTGGTAPGPAEPEACTSIMVGRLATADGSVITSHTCDANYRTWVTVEPAGTHKKGSMAKIWKGRLHTAFPSDQRGLELAGRIPQVEKTYAFLNTAYPCMNEHQLAIGESTFGGRKELRSRKGIFLIEELERIALERCRTAREAIRLIGRLAEEYGYIDAGEALTLADPREVWHMEILGPGKGRKGAVWAARRIPDDHVGVAANICRIGEIQRGRPDFFMASKNVFSLAKEMGWWKPGKDGPFKFWKAYSGRKPFGIREWWVFHQLAPHLKLDFEHAEELPFSVKPEKKVTIRDVFDLFKATYEGSPYDLTGNLTIPDKRTGKRTKPIHVSPWLPRDLQRLFNELKPGTVKFHRPIAVAFNAYHVILQCRSGYPDPIGGICWLGFDNPAETPAAPIFCGVTDLPGDFKVDAQKGFRRDSAAWAFRRAARLAAFQWGRTKKRMAKEIRSFEDQALAELPLVEKKALELYKKDPAACRAFLTRYSVNFCRAMTHRYWELGDELWSLYNWRL